MMIEKFIVNHTEFKLISHNLGSKTYYELKSNGLCKVFETKFEALAYIRFWLGV